MELDKEFVNVLMLSNLLETWEKLKENLLNCLRYSNFVEVDTSEFGQTLIC